MAMHVIHIAPQSQSRLSLITGRLSTGPPSSHRRSTRPTSLFPPWSRSRSHIRPLPSRTSLRVADKPRLRKIRVRQGRSRHTSTSLFVSSHPRSSSSHGQSRRNNVRQPSPPIHTSQVEGPILSSAQSFSHRNTNPATNSFDPFVVNSDSDSDNNSRAPFPSSTKLPPTLAVPPSGKIARRRNQIAQPPVTPSPASRPVPVPRGKQPAHRNNLSRSAPNPQAFPRIEKRRASAAYAMDFPVCDDTTDVEDTSPPSTPTREFFADTAWQRLSLDGPRTAPLSSFNGFSFANPADSTPSRTRHHHRSPSEGVFNMSFDEDMSTTSDASEELKKLFGFPPKRFGSVGPSATRAGKDKAGFFASSVFQNSPSPDELPPPAF